MHKLAELFFYSLSNNPMLARPNMEIEDFKEANQRELDERTMENLNMYSDYPPDSAVEKEYINIVNCEYEEATSWEDVLLAQEMSILPKRSCKYLQKPILGHFARAQYLDGYKATGPFIFSKNK